MLGNFIAGRDGAFRWGAGTAASGSVASISGTTMEVQSTTAGQTSVSWTASSAFGPFPFLVGTIQISPCTTNAMRSPLGLSAI